jgi:hypothetical protein
MNNNLFLSSGGIETLEARFGLRVATRLNDATRELPYDMSERLKAARESALERARLARRTQTAGAVQSLSSGVAGTLLLGSNPNAKWWLRLASAVPVMVLVAGFMLIDHVHTKAQIKVAAEIDAALLADDVPPAAYGDPGFVEFLKVPRD